ncbi:MAG: acyloxyacyl hydrolase [Gammaproteobacteria bacterium]|nr:acyloxyacyl hydrolase [Gammaproteobacteria bacterium]
MTVTKWYKLSLHSYLISSFGYIGSAILLSVVLTINSYVIAEDRQEYEMFNITAGQIGILDDLDGPQRYGLEYRFKSFSGPGGFRLIPAVGAARSNNGANFVYSDLRHDFYLNRRWILIPSFGIGIFNDSDEINLGNDLEFRSGVEIAYQFKNKIRAGVAIFHLSNGGISSQNPGTEALVFSICIPVISD